MTASAPIASARLSIKNRLGLHARAASLLVQAVAGFEADVHVAKDDQRVNGKSILGLLMLAAAQGSTIEVTAEGRDAAAAVAAITTLVESGFYEDT